MIAANEFKLICSGNGRVYLFAHARYLMWVNNNSHTYFSLRKANIKKIFPDYYQEIIDVFPIVFDRENNKNIKINKQFLENNEKEILTLFFNLYEQQLLIFKLTNTKPYLEIDLR